MLHFIQGVGAASRRDHGGGQLFMKPLVSTVAEALSR